MNPNYFVKKNDKIYECIFCDFLTSKKTNYTIHLETKKHKNNEILQNPNDFVKKNDKFDCECGKSYKHKTTLCNHKKKCAKENILSTKEGITDTKQIIETMLQQSNFIKTLMEQNNALQNTINEIIPKIGNSNNIINSNNNINISLFLNENCKDALSMDEFIKKINVSINDLLFTKQKGLINGISNIFIKNLNDLPEKKRPIWCTDKKRKKIFVKHEEWAEDVDNIKTKQAIKDISFMQVKNINKYTDKNPDWKEKDNKKDEYIAIVKNITTDIVNKEPEVINKMTDDIYLDNDKKNVLTY